MNSNTNTTLSLGGLKKKSGGPSKNSHPIYPATPEEKEMAQTVIDLAGQIEQLEGALKIAESELKGKATEWFFRHFNGKTSVESTVKIPTTSGLMLGVTLSSRYSQVHATVGDDDAENPAIIRLRRAMGEAFNRFMKEAVTITIDSKKIPEAEVQPLIDNLIAIAEMHGAQEAISAKQCFTPLPAFHTERHTAFDVETNTAIHRDLPCVVSVRKKGVK
jgi:hypothetical protein